MDHQVVVLLGILVSTFNLTACTSNKSPAPLSIRKCCPLGYAINETLTGCEPKHNNDWVIERGLLAELPVNFTRSIASVGEEAAFHIPCKTPQVMSLMWMEGDESDFHVNHITGFLRPAIPVVQDGPMEFNEHEYCLDEFKGATVALACPCIKGTCVNVCCERGMLVDTSSPSHAQCVVAGPAWSSWHLENVSVPTTERRFFTAYGSVPQCETDSSGYHILNNDAETHHRFQVLSNGSLLVHSTPPMLVEPANYCVGVITYVNTTTVNVIHCGSDLSPERLHALIYTSLFLVGALFLLATLVVHALLPELRRSVRGLSLMAHCACMFVAHISLTIVQLEGSTIGDLPCHFLAYIIQYSLLAGFFWMNVMCIDIAFTFRSLRSMAHGGSAEYRKFLLYTLYAMGAPFLIFLVTLWADASSIIPAAIKPDIGVKYCWFDKFSHAILIFFYGPIGLLLLFNLALFVFTAFKIFQFTREGAAALSNQPDSHRHDRRNADRKRFMLFLKLFGLMGIPWIMEIISWAVGGKDYYWYLTDAINLLRSVFIFIMFCCKRKVWLMLTKRHPRMTARISTRLSRGTSTTNQGDDGSTATQRSSVDLPTSAARSTSTKTKPTLELKI